MNTSEAHSEAGTLGCDHVQAQLTAYVLGDLPDSQRAVLHGHIDECERCQAAATQIEPTLDLLRAALAAPLAAPLSLPPERRARVLSRASRSAPPTPLWLVRRHPWLAAAAAASLMGGFILLSINLGLQTRMSSRVYGDLSMALPDATSADRAPVDDFSWSEEGGEAEERFRSRPEGPMTAPQQELGRPVQSTTRGFPMGAVTDGDDDGLADVIMDGPVAMPGSVGGDEERRTLDHIETITSPVVMRGIAGSRSSGQRGGTLGALDAVMATLDLSESKKLGITYNGGASDLEPTRPDRPEPVPSEIVAGSGSVVTWYYDDAGSSEGHGSTLSTLGGTVNGVVTVPADPAAPAVSARSPARPPRVGKPTIPPAKSDARPLTQYGYDASGRRAEAHVTLEDRVADGEADPFFQEANAPHDEKMTMKAANAHPISGEREDLFSSHALPSAEQGGGVDTYVVVDEPSARESQIVAVENKAELSRDGTGVTRDYYGLAMAPAKEKREDARTTNFRAFGVNPFFATRAQPFSTFAIDVDTASYTVARNYMTRGYRPPAESVRTEEFVNFFDYAYRPPERDTFRIYAELAPSKFGRGLDLLKIGVKGRRLGREEQRRAVLTFLVDTSGSMDQPDRMGLVKQSLHMVVDSLDPADRVAIVQYGSEARLLLEHTPATERAAITAAIDGLQCSGSTNLEKGMRRAYRVAAQAFEGGAENRVLLLSDGVATLGTGTAADILNDVAQYRRQGITCSVFGFGMGTYDDVMLETLANKGDGTYQFVDSEREARRIFVDDLSATLNTIATDVKIQVEFMADGVTRYRQLGYENRQLKKEDFRNNRVDAGEVGSGQSVTALYELELAPGGPVRVGRSRPVPQVLAVVRVRYRRVDTGEVEEIERVVTRADLVASFDEAPLRFRLAACVAEFAEILRGSPFAAGSDGAGAADVLRPVALELRLDKRVQELVDLVQGADSLSDREANRGSRL